MARKKKVRPQQPMTKSRLLILTGTKRLRRWLEKSFATGSHHPWSRGRYPALVYTTKELKAEIQSRVELARLARRAKRNDR